MAYVSTIPQAADYLSVSQGDLQDNFLELNTAWNTNHVPFNVGDEGKHWFIHFPNQAVGAATNATEVGLFAVGGALYFRPANHAAGAVTATDKLLMGSYTNVGYTMSSGIKTTWWTIPQVTDAAWYNVPVGGGYPVFTTIYTVQVTTKRNLVDLSYPVCYGNTLGTGTLLDPWRVQLRTRNAANNSAAVILLIGS